MYSDDNAAVKQERRKCERHWRRAHLTIHRNVFKTQRLRVSNVIKQTKIEYYLNTLSTYSDHKLLCDLFRQMTAGSRDRTSPSHTSLIELMQKFSVFFDFKI